MSENHFPSDDLAWDAFRYAAGEMNAAEGARFEERLACEQPAREALAAAVELAQASALAMSGAGILPMSYPVASAKCRRNWLWPVLGAAACLAAVVSVAALGVGNWNTHRELARQQAKQNELAARWSEVRELNAVELAGDEPGDPLETLADFAVGEAEGSAVDARADDQLVTAPDWMLAAVVGLKNQELMDDEQRVDPPQDQ
jgi:hypothetical protein